MDPYFSKDIVRMLKDALSEFFRGVLFVKIILIVELSMNTK